MSQKEKGKEGKAEDKGKKEEKKKVEEEPEQLDIEMKAGDYRVLVHILEAKDIKAKGKAGGGGFLANFEGETCDPMIEVDVMGQTKCTDYKAAQLSPIFNTQMFFEFQNQRAEDLETGMIKISLLDHDFIGSNNMIGSFTVDLSYIYKMNKDHELYRMWVAMTDMGDETQQINGLVKVSINVLGPGDKPPVHDPSKNLKDKNDNGASKLFTPGRVKLSGHQIHFCLYRCEHLAPLDLEANSLDAYAKLSFAGEKAQSKSVKQDRNPEINQELILACKIPSMNNKIKFEIWDDDLASDERVGTFYFNFKDLCKQEIRKPAPTPSNKSPSKRLSTPMIGEKKPSLNFENAQEDHIQTDTSAPAKKEHQECRWGNLYGPPLHAEGEYADLMTKFGDKGSHYRGRFLYEIFSHDEEMPKSQVKDINFKFPNKPAPYPKEKTYLLKVALYEGVELPEREKFCIHICCGPYKIQSSLLDCVNSRVVWNQTLPDLMIRSSSNIEDVQDVIIYLSTSEKPNERICFKRLKAKDLLDDVKEFKIEQYLLEEDKSLDMLDDEEFPGIIYARMKLYSKDLDEQINPNISLFKDESAYKEFLLHIHLFMGRDLPSADDTGTADPFIIARCQGQKGKSRTKLETLNPGFFETLELVIKIPPLGDPDYPQPGLSLLVYDEDIGILGKKKDLLGRIWIELEKDQQKIKCSEDGSFQEVYSHKPQQWYDVVFDATGEKEGKILIGYDLIPISLRNYFPLDKISIQPHVFPGQISIAIIGVRDVVSSLDLFPIKKMFAKFDISGDSKEPIISNKHPVKDNSSNFFEIIAVDLDIPHELIYSPVLTVYAYDNLMGFLGTRLLGITNIPLEKYCKKLTEDIQFVLQAFNSVASSKGVISPKNVKIKLSKIQEVGEEEEIKKDSNKSSPWAKVRKLKPQILSANKPIGDVGKQVETTESQQRQTSQKDLQLTTRELLPKMDKEEENKQLQIAKKKAQVEEFKNKMIEEQKLAKEKKKEIIQEREQKSQEQKEKINLMKKCGKFMKDQLDYNSDPNEDLDMTPEWIKGRETVSDELEDTMGPPPFDKWKIMRGQSRGKANFLSKTVQNNKTVTGILKTIIKLKEKHQASEDIDDDLVKYMQPKNFIARVYVLKGKSLTPKDANTSDPYLVLKLGDKEIVDKESLRVKTCNANFYRSYDIPITLPGSSMLYIQCWDDDGFDFPDLIGTTKIDLEDRFFNKEWNEKYPALKPIEERTLFVEKSSAPQGVLTCWIEILDPKVASANPKIDISLPPKEEYELRVIIWGTRDVVFADTTTKCNDLYVVGILGDKKLETDTHWRCRTQGSFNWRMKFPMILPLDPDEDYGKDVLTLQLWDRDIVKANDMICETQIHLNDESYPMLEKAYKRRDHKEKEKKVIVMKKTGKENKIVDRFWLCFTHPEQVDKDGNFIPQGYCEVSIELVPKQITLEKPAGHGREAPNMNPILPEPKGRFKFDIFSPWQMMKELLGPALARKLCCIVYCTVFCLLFLYWMFFFGGNLIANSITAAANNAMNKPSSSSSKNNTL